MQQVHLKYTWAMVCTTLVETLKAMGLQMNVLARTRMVVKGVKGSRLTVLGAVAVAISAGGRTVYQILYVTKETKRLILSRMCLEH